MSEEAQALVGRTVAGRFKLTGFIGEGAMAMVYRGEQDAEPRDVAVKIMHPQLLRDRTFAKRFAREAMAAARIEHKNTVRMLEHGADGDLYYLAMELCAGQDLFELLARERRLPEARAARILIQICAALSAAHTHGIVHRDLKPENVMIIPDPDAPGAELVKVLDFGIAKLLEKSSGFDRSPDSQRRDSTPPSSVLTMVGSLVGTPEYMSPEQAMGAAVDARSDVYACGVLLFHVVTGRPPFTGGTPVDVMLQQPTKPPPLPSSLLTAIHPGLEALILKALAKKPEDRPQSAQEFADALAAILPELAVGSRRTPIATTGTATPLPGVPGAITVSAERPTSDVPPPETLRSPPPSSPTHDGAASGPKPRAGTARANGAVDEVAAIAAKAEAKAEPIVAAITPAREARKERTNVVRTLPVKRAADRWVAPWWVFVIATVIASLAIWLVRYMRFR